MNVRGSRPNTIYLYGIDRPIDLRHLCYVASEHRNLNVLKPYLRNGIWFFHGCNVWNEMPGA